MGKSGGMLSYNGWPSEKSMKKDCISKLNCKHRKDMNMLLSDGSPNVAYLYSYRYAASSEGPAFMKNLK